MLVKMTNEKEIQQLKEEFQKIDTDGSGTISVDELKAAFKKGNEKISISQLETIIDEVDYAGNHQINYLEFISATLEGKAFQNENMLRALFNSFDTD